MNEMINTFVWKDGIAVRTAGTASKPLFCGVDVARALGYVRPADAVAAHCKGVGVLPTPSGGGMQQTKFIEEADLYRLILKSKAQNAERFQDWVCEDVLPAIRRTGQYGLMPRMEGPFVMPCQIDRIRSRLRFDWELEVYGALPSVKSGRRRSLSAWENFVVQHFPTSKPRRSVKPWHEIEKFVPGIHRIMYEQAVIGIRQGKNLLAGSNRPALRIPVEKPVLDVLQQVIDAIRDNKNPCIVIQ